MAQPGNKTNNWKLVHLFVQVSSEENEDGEIETCVVITKPDKVEYENIKFEGDVSVIGKSFLRMPASEFVTKEYMERSAFFHAVNDAANHVLREGISSKEESS